MKCLNKSCGSENLLAHVQASLAIPLAKKGGSIHMAGLTVKQTDVKAWWDGTEDDPKLIRGPIICPDCLEEHVYLKGLQPSLVKMSYVEALQLGYDHFAKNSQKGEE